MQEIWKIYTVHSLSLIAEGMVVIKRFTSKNILNAVLCFISFVFVFDAEYPKAASSLEKCFLFLDGILIRKHEKTLPMGVEMLFSTIPE